MLNLSSPAFKKAALLALGLSTPTWAIASLNGAPFNGYYGGIMGGVMRTDSQFTTYSSALYNTFFDSDNELSTGQSNVNVYKYTGTGAVYLGYGHFIADSKFYLAGEFFGNWATRRTALYNTAYHANLGDESDDNNLQSLSTSTTVKLRNSEFDIDLRPGYLLDVNTLVYARVGVAFNKITATNSTNFSYTGLVYVPGSSNSILSQSRSHTKTALRLGVGLEHRVAENLSITADYIYTYYGKVKSTNIGDTTFDNGEDSGSFAPNFVTDGSIANSSAHIGTQTAMLGIKYYFYPVC